MADPAWGAASPLSDEDTARILCAFHHTDPLPTQRHRPLRSQLQQRSPSNGSCHVQPMPVRRDEAVSMLLAPSMSCDDWRRWQQCVMQHQLEQQGELRVPTNQQRQREIQEYMEAQIWQQEQAQRQEGQAQRIAERMLQPHYSTGAGGLEQPGWHSLRAFTPRVDRGGGPNTAMQQSGQLYNAQIECSEQSPVRTTTAPIPTHSCMSDYRGTLQSGVLMDRNDEVFAVQQDPQIVQAHLQARHPENLAINAARQWGRHNVMLLAEIQPERTKVSQMQTMQRYIQQQPLQPQPYCPAETNQRSRQVIGTLGQASGSSFDDSFLDGIMEHFSTNAAPAAGNATAADASAGCNPVFDKARKNKATFNATRAESQIKTGAEVQGQIDVNSRPPIPPSGTAVVPGVSLTSHAVRLVTMLDILNSEDGFCTVDSSTNRLRGGKQKRAPKRKIPRKKNPAKRQKMSQQNSVQNSQQLPTNQPVEALLSSQSANGVTVSAHVPTTRPYTPMHLAFLESQAARASEQAAGITNTRPSISAISTMHSQSLLPASVTQLSTKFASQNIVAYEKPNAVNRKMVDATSDMGNNFATHQSIQQLPPQDTVRLESAMNEANFSQSSAPEAKQNANESNTLLRGQNNVDSVWDNPMDKAFGQHRRQHSSPEVSASLKAANNVQSSIKLDVVENGKDAIISKKISRAKRSLARLIPLTADGQKQQVHGMLPSAEGLVTRMGSIATTVVAPATVKYTPVVSKLPRMENRTVVIFCKRDFMRYQAAKIWRKYQEQLEKHEEWREVRVAGKRTRYLNSRYDDEIRRTHSKTFTKLRRKSLQEKGGICSHKASFVIAGSTSVRRVASSCVPVDNEADERTSPARKRDGTKTSADSRNASDDCSLSGKRGVADGVESLVTNDMHHSH